MTENYDKYANTAMAALKNAYETKSVEQIVEVYRTEALANAMMCMAEAIREVSGSLDLIWGAIKERQ
jgi:hypothetical protein